MSLTPRDRKVILHLGYHGWLSHRQIGLLEFPYEGKQDFDYSYQTLQRRTREELLKNKWIDREYLPDKEGNITTIFRLSRKGVKLFNRDTNKKALRPRFSQLKVPHRLEVNDVLTSLKTSDTISINGFELEKKLGSIRPDAYVKYKTPFCLEIDLSGGEIESFIKNKWQQYEKEYMQDNLKCNYVVWYSDRSNQLYKWIDKQTNLEPLFIDLKPNEIFKVISYINPGIKSAINSM